MDQDFFNEPYITSEEAANKDWLCEPFLADFAPATSATIFIPWIDTGDV